MKDQMSDKERILLQLIVNLASTQILAGGQLYSAESFGDHVHFAYYKKPEPGDLVLCKTSGIHPYTVGWYVSGSEYGTSVIREIGTDRLCNVSNDSFLPIVGMYKDHLLERDQRAVYLKVQQAFRRGGSFGHMFGGLDFEVDEIVITIREYMGGFGKTSIPYKVRMKWTKTMSVKSILEAMSAAGYDGPCDIFRPEGVLKPSDLADIVLE